MTSSRRTPDDDPRHQDWRSLAADRGVPRRQAEALYVQARRQSGGGGRTMSTYRALLDDHGAGGGRPSPGKVTLTMREAGGAASPSQPGVAAGKRPLTSYLPSTATVQRRQSRRRAGEDVAADVAGAGARSQEPTPALDGLVRPFTAPAAPAGAVVQRHPGDGRGGDSEADEAGDLAFLGRLVHDGNGGWTHPDGRALGPGEQRRLRRALAARARSGGMTPAALRAYQVYLDTHGNPPLDEHTWQERHGRSLAQLDDDHGRMWEATDRAGDPAYSDRTATNLPRPPDHDEVEVPPREGSLRARRADHSVGSLDGAAPDSSSVPLDDDRRAVHVNIGERGNTTGDHVLSTRGLDGCTGISVVATGQDGSQRRLEHVAESDQAGAYSRLVDAIAETAPDSGQVRAHVDIDAAQRQGEGGFPSDHGELLQRLRGDLQQRFGSQRQVRIRGNDLVVRDREGREVLVRVGVSHRSVDADGGAVRTELTQGPEGIRTQPHERDATLMDHDTAARQGHGDVQDRAARLRAVLEERAADPARSRSERTLARLALRDLDDAGPTPTAEHVEQVAYHANVSADELRSGRSGPPATPSAGGSAAPASAEGAEPDPAESAAPALPRRSPAAGHPSEEAAEAAEAEPSAPAGARPGTRSGRPSGSGGGEPVEAGEPERPAESGEPGPTIPTQGPRVTGRRGSVDGDGRVHIDEHRDDGSSRGLSGGITRRGVHVGGQRTSASGEQRSLGLGIEAQRDADGEVTGADATLSVGLGPVSYSLSGGYTFRADTPQRQEDGSYQVSWEVGVRAGQGAGVSAGPVSVSRSGQGSLSRSGTEVFADGTPEQNRDAAVRFQNRFRDADADTVREQFFRAARGDQGTLEWWREQPVGTARTVRVGGEISHGFGANILVILNLGVDVPVRGSVEAQVSKPSQAAVTVVEAFEVGGAVNPTVGVPGVGVRGAGMSGIENQGRYRVEYSFRVDLEAGAEPLRRFLARSGYIETGQPGVTMLSQRTERESGETAGVDLGPLSIDGSSTTTTIRETTIGEDGQEVERVTHRGEQGFTGNTMMGDYSRSRMRVDAPEDDSPYLVTSDIHGSEGDESASMLARQAGTTGADTRRASSSGNWQLTEEVSQGEARQFHVELLDRFPADGDGPELGSPLRGVWGELRGVPTDASGQAARARIMAGFLSEHGRRGMRLVRGLSGGADSTRYVRLFGREGEDQNFLGRHRSREIEDWIRTHRGQPLAPADVSEARAKIADLDRRIEAIANPDNYTDMPPPLRAEVLERYRGYQAQLRQLMTHTGDELAADMSEEGQAHHAELQAAQREVEAARNAAARAREQVVRERERYGQAASERVAEVRLPPNIGSRTEAMWSSAETAWIGAEDARRAAEAALERTLEDEAGHGEHTQRAGYRSAQGELERARAAYRQARQEMRRLAGVYHRIEQARRGELDADSGDDEAAPANQGHRPTSAAGDRAGTDRGAGGRRSGPAPSDAGEGEADTAAAPEPRAAGPERLVVPAALVAPHIHVESIANATVDAGPITLPNGLGVRLLRARHVTVPSADAARLEQQLGRGDVFNVAMEIVTEAPDAAATFVVRAYGEVSAGGGAQLVSNSVGERFTASVYRAAR
ncbi:hypothetical protein [Haliangium sp.]|uniref:hypothetical protein n=1 Tax=Haliangium sp. TaxID=2663208 RepID=UPI003D0F3BC3